MERYRKTVETGQLLEEYRELLQSTKTLPLQVTGRSMTPFLIPGRDSVTLTALQASPKRGDIILYQRENGSYVLHRVVTCQRDGRYTMLGDGQQQREKDICREQMFAKVCVIHRKGKLLKPGCFWWEFFEKIWSLIVPLRPLCLRLYGIITGLGRKKSQV